LNSQRGYFWLCLAMGVAATGVVAAVRHRRLGRLLDGLADSPLAMTTNGASANVTRIIVFCLSAFMAAVGGALYVGVVGSVSSEM